MTVQLNQATDYAFRAVLYLASRPAGAVVSARELAEAQAIPPRFVLKIMHALTQAGLIDSRRGPAGGFGLARPAADISLLDVIEALEGPVAIHRCLADREACNRHCTSECPVHAALHDLQDELVAGLRRATFASLAKNQR